MGILEFLPKPEELPSFSDTFTVVRICFDFSTDANWFSSVISLLTHNYTCTIVSSFSCCRAVASRLHLRSVGKVFLWLAKFFFLPFWQIQIFPLLPEGRISVGVPARVGHAAGKSWYQRFRKARTHTSQALEKHKSLHIHHPTRAPLTSSFFIQATDRAGSLSLSEHAIWIPSFFSEHPSHNLIHWAFVFCFDKLSFRANDSLKWLPEKTIWHVI